MWEYSTNSKAASFALVCRRPPRATRWSVAPSNGRQYTGRRSPHLCDELCLPANHGAGSPAVAANKRWPVQASIRWGESTAGGRMERWRSSRQEVGADHFLSQRGVDICLLTETHIRPEVFRLANYVCHRTDRPTEGGGKALLVRRGIDHYAVPILCLIQLEATAIHIMLASGPVKILAVYLPAPDRTCLPGRRASRYNGGGLECQARGLKFTAAHDKWQAPAWLCQRTFLFDLRAGHTHH